MKFVKLKLIEIFTNGSLNFIKLGWKSSQIYINQKDYKNSIFMKKTKSSLKHKYFSCF